MAPEEIGGHETFSAFWKSKHCVRRLNKLTADEVSSIAYAEICDGSDRE